MVEAENSSRISVSQEESTLPTPSIDNQTREIKKKRNLPGMPDPDAEVIALSPKALLATNRFICEICSKGFQRDQNLQLHRRGHNLPWKLRQRTSKEVRKRVYVCPEVTCIHHDPARALGDLTGIKKHFCRKHGDKKYQCQRCSKKYAVQSDWKAHMKTCGTREYRCDCGTLFSRRDSFITHRAFCDALAQEDARSRPPAVDRPRPEASSPPTQTIPAASSSPPPPLTPSTGVLSPDLSVQSSAAELSENPIIHLQLQRPPVLTSSTAVATSSSATSGGSAVNPCRLFSTIFTSPSSELTQPSHSPPSYSALPHPIAAVDPMSLSLSPSLYGTLPSFPATSQNSHCIQSPQPVLSATALLQKAAQMGATSSNSSFLHGLGLVAAAAAPSDTYDAVSTTTAASTCCHPQWGSGMKVGNHNPTSGFRAGFPMNCSPCFDQSPLSSESAYFVNRPSTTATVDFLGLGMGGGEDPSRRFSAFLSSIDGGINIPAASISGRDSWEDSTERKPSML